MDKAKKICVFTGTRAEYGLLSRLMRLIADSPGCQLQVVVTNMHLMPEHGLTYREIEADGFHIDAKVPMPKASDDAVGIIDSMADGLKGMGRAIEALQPDLAVILGDRYEMLMAATACLMSHVPIAHIHGGETTLGAIDDSIRHAITQMATLHFTATEAYRQRVVEMGAKPECAFFVGSLGVENILSLPLMDADALTESLDGWKVDSRTLIATYHPATLGTLSAKEEIDEFLAALDEFPDFKVLFTMPNSDEGSRDIRQAIEAYCQKDPRRCKAVDSLGLRRYLSAVKQSAAVIGNSSSGIIEVPFAGKPTLNIGPRQDGRVRGASVVDCGPAKAEIAAALRTLLSHKDKCHVSPTDNPYYKPGTARAIFDIISK